MLIFLQIFKCPCPVKCIYEIRQSSYRNIDSLYSAKHQYVKSRIIEAIIDRYYDRVKLSSEYSIPTGKLDIAIFPNSQLFLKFDNKVIGIEVKSGKWTDASIFYQIERYVLYCD